MAKAVAQTSARSRTRCWYCGEVRTRWSREHVVALELGGKLVVRFRVCKDCNEQAGREIDGPFGRQFLIAVQRAVYGVPKRGGGMAKASRVGEVVGGGRAHIEWNAKGGELKIWGTESGGRRAIQTSMEMSIRLWARFSSKVAIATASMALDERWLDTERGKELRAFVRANAFPTSLWPNGAPLPVALPHDDAVAQRLRRDQHLLSVMSIGGEAVVGIILFGVWATAVPLAVNLAPGKEVAWLLDPHEPAPVARSYWDLMADLGEHKHDDPEGAESGDSEEAGTPTGEPNP